MDRSLALLVIGLLLGGGIGFVVAAGYGVTLGGHDHDAPGDHSGPAGHGMTGMGATHDTMLALVDDGTAPELDITVLKDPVSGWNLHLNLANFRFAPEQAGLAHVDGEGHAHVFVNGAKIARLYGEWMHIAALPRGRATIRVTLNSNTHQPLAVGDTAIAASIGVTVD